jgi:hypothetical protein
MFGSQAPGTIEVFRLYNSFSGGHLFTINAAERDFALSIVDAGTGIQPWSQNNSLGFAYFSDADHAFRAPHSAPAVAAVESESVRAANDLLFDTTHTASLAGVTASSTSWSSESNFAAAENVPSGEFKTKPLTYQHESPAASSELDHLFANLNELTSSLP